MGRPSKLNQELQDAICATIADGNFPEVAAAYHGISSATFYKWMSFGKDTDNPKSARYVEFREAIAQARAKAKVDLTTTVRIQSRAKMGGNHAQWMLEKLDRRKYGERIRVEVANQLEAALAAIERVTDVETFSRILDALDALDDEPSNDVVDTETPAVH